MSKDRLNSFRLRWRTGIPLLNSFAHLIGWHHPLDAEWLINKAQQKTGLHTWGSLDVKEPLTRVIKDYENSGLLTPFGRSHLKDTLVHFLCNRLRIEDRLLHKPEILDQDILKPVFIVGLPRSGTTLLYHLLALDPKFRALKTYETFNPTDARKPGFLSRRIFNWGMDFLLPNLQAIHPRSPLRIEECTWLLFNTFYAPGAFSLFGSANNYENWLLELPDHSWSSAYNLYKAQLQILQSNSNPPRWLLKSPAHVSNLEILLHVFPDARIIMPKRSIHQSFPSMASLFATMRSLANDPVETNEGWHRILKLTCQVQNSLPAVIKKHSQSIKLIDFDDLVKDASGTIKSIYHWLDMEPPADFNQMLAEYQRKDSYTKDRHQYTLEQFGLTARDLDALCKDNLSNITGVS